MTLYKDYELIVGLEVHVELKTQTKIFCRCKTHFGAAPNTQCCPVCTGLPGSLPVLNSKVIDYAIKAGLALGCDISRFTKFDRKNYFYPDLPKAYQISQFDKPLCKSGHVRIQTSSGEKNIGITRIHVEEDAGKLLHDSTLGTLIDCNRCGVPLIEIVSEPDIRSAEEAVAYLKKLRSIIMYTRVSDCKMNEGSFRCDVNLSVRKKGQKDFGTRTEMKNINSFQFVAKAIEYEYKRQVDSLENGVVILQQTRRFDSQTGKTYSMRTKENANDYRYFPEPDIPPITISDEKIAALKDEIPVLPDQRCQKYVRQYFLSQYDAQTLTAELYISDYFEKAALTSKYPKVLANLIISEVFSMLDDTSVIPISAENFAKLSDLLGEGTINSPTAKKLLRQLWDKDEDPQGIVQRQGLSQINDASVIEHICNDIILQNQKSVSDYKNGKTAAFKALVGKVMANTSGRANPVLVNQILENLLK